MIVVHHLNNSRSQRILWLLEELGLPYEIKKYQRDPKTMLAPPELRAVHPLGKSPVITDGDTMVAESGAIIEYLVETYGERPPGAAGRHAGQAPALHLFPALRGRLGDAAAAVETGVRPRRDQPDAVLRRARSRAPSRTRSRAASCMPQIRQHLDFLEGELAAARPGSRATRFPRPTSRSASRWRRPPRAAGWMRSYPKLTAFLERIHARPAYQRALERGGKYDYAK